MVNRLRDMAMEQRDARWATLLASVDTLLKQRPGRGGAAVEGEGVATVHSCTDLGMQSVPVYKIAAASARFAVFDHWLLPHAPAPVRLFSAAERRAAYLHEVIELYKVGDTYFVKDGNQRIVQARRRGQLFLPARVVEYTFGFATDGRTRVYNLLVREEQRAFLEATQCARLRPEHQILCTTLGNYQLLQAQIMAYHARCGCEMSLAEALAAWYDTIYLPLVSVARAHKLGVYFPLQGESDLYLWATERGARRSLAHSSPGAAPLPAQRQRRATLAMLAALQRALRHDVAF